MNKGKTQYQFDPMTGEPINHSELPKSDGSSIPSNQSINTVDFSAKKISGRKTMILKLLVGFVFFMGCAFLGTYLYDNRDDNTKSQESQKYEEPATEELENELSDEQTNEIVIEDKWVMTKSYNYEKVRGLCGITEYEYDINGNMVKSSFFPDEKSETPTTWIVFIYDNNSNCIKETDYIFSGQQVGTTDYIYENGLLVKEIDYGIHHTTTYEYDGSRLVKKNYYNFLNGVDELTAWHEYYYDEKDRLIDEKMSDESHITYEYDDNDRLIIEKHYGVQNIYEYDSNGNMIKKSQKEERVDEILNWEEYEWAPLREYLNNKENNTQ